MRLLHAKTFEFKDIIDPHTDTKYAILSHTWTSKEVVYNDLVYSLPSAQQRPEFAKVRFTAQQALEDGFEYIWVDSCCIDKSSSAELSESINSMYLLYKNAQICYIYLEDIFEPPPTGWTDDGDNDEPWTRSFVSSRWFTRGWTLQELIAPRKGVFYTKDWQRIGAKRELCLTLATHTRISSPTLLGEGFGRTLVAERMSWAANRITTRVEDIAYCLLGIFDINMPLLYGEGERAFLRLQHEIIKKTNDRSIFLWKATEESHTSFRSLFAQSPAEFAFFFNHNLYARSGRFEITQEGLEIDLALQPTSKEERASYDEVFGIVVYEGRTLYSVVLRHLGGTFFARVDASDIFQMDNLSQYLLEDAPPPKTFPVIIPHTLDEFIYESQYDSRLWGFYLAYHPVELQILKVKTNCIWDEEKKTVELKVREKDGDGPVETEIQLVLCEVSNPDQTYEIDLASKMYRPGGFQMLGTLGAEEGQNYAVHVKKQFFGDKLMNFVHVEYIVGDGLWNRPGAWTISSERKLTAGSRFRIRRITREESNVIQEYASQQRQEDNNESDIESVEETTESIGQTHTTTIKESTDVAKQRPLALPEKITEVVDKIVSAPSEETTEVVDRTVSRLSNDMTEVKEQILPSLREENTEDVPKETSSLTEEKASGCVKEETSPPYAKQTPSQAQDSITSNTGNAATLSSVDQAAPSSSKNPLTLRPKSWKTRLQALWTTSKGEKRNPRRLAGMLNRKRA